MVNIDTVLNRAHVYLKDNISKSCKEDFDIVQAFLFMNLCDRSKLKEKYVDFYDKYVKEYRTNKDFKKSIDICLNKLKLFYEDQEIELKDGTIVDGKNHFDNIINNLNKKYKIEEMDM